MKFYENETSVYEKPVKKCHTTGERMRRPGSHKLCGTKVPAKSSAGTLPFRRLIERNSAGELVLSGVGQLKANYRQLFEFEMLKFDSVVRKPCVYGNQTFESILPSRLQSIQCGPNRIYGVKI